MLSLQEKKLGIVVIDTFILSVVAVIALALPWVIGEASLEDAIVQWPWVMGLALLLLMIGYLNDGLDITSLRDFRLFLRRWLASWGIALGVYLLYYFFFSSGTTRGISVQVLPRIAPFTFLLLTVAVIPLGRLASGRFFGISSLLKTCIIIGAGHSGRHFVKEVASSSGEWHVVGILDDDQAKHGTSLSGVQILGSCDQLLPWVEKLDVQEVVLAINGEIRREIIDVLMSCFEMGIAVYPVLTATERMLQRIPIHHLGDHWLPATFWASSDTPLLFRLTKRSIDIAVAGLLGIITLPVIGFALLGTLLTSRGPVFYRQQRVGFSGRPFWITKIRTMVRDAEPSGQAQWAVAGDKRITPFGGFLRRTRIDELPQLWNVIRGEMSLVGPRPERPEFVQKLQSEIPYYRARLCMCPGLTGWAQILYRYGNSVEDAKVKLEYDLYYVKNRCVWLDLIILFKTVKTVALFRGT